VQQVHTGVSRRLGAIVPRPGPEHQTAEPLLQDLLHAWYTLHDEISELVEQLAAKPRTRG